MSSFSIPFFGSKPKETTPSPPPQELPPSILLSNARKVQDVVNKAHDLLLQGREPTIDRQGFRRYAQVFLEIKTHCSSVILKAQNGEEIDPTTSKEFAEISSILINTSAKILPVFQKVMLPHIPSNLPEKETALHWAVRHHQHEDARLLMQYGSSLEEDADGLTPLDEACLQKDIEMQNILLYGGLDAASKQRIEMQFADAKKKMDAIRNAASSSEASLSLAASAASTGNLETLSKISDIDTPNEQGLTPLHYAILSRNHEAVLFLLYKGAKMTHLTKEGMTYLDYAIVAGDATLYRLFSGQIPEIPIHLPFKMDDAEKQLSYLIAADLLRSLNEMNALAKDPLSDKTGVGMIGFTNLLSLGAIGLTKAITWGMEPLPINPTPEIMKDFMKNLGWGQWFLHGGYLASQFLEQGTSSFRFWNALPFLYQQGWAPKHAVQYFPPIYQGLAGIGGIAHLIGQGSVWLGYNNPLSSQLSLPEDIAKQPSPAKIMEWWQPEISKFGFKAFAGIRLAGVAQATLSKAGLYWKHSTSRPRDVAISVAKDAATLATEALFCAMSFGAFG